MTVGVLTFHRCINYGSYWQARCLVERLAAKGMDAVLLDHHARRVNRAEWRCALQPALPERTRPEDRPLYAAKVRKFFDAFEQLPLSAPFPLDRPDQMPTCELAVIGSDEVWNMSHPWYGGATPFWGEGLNAPQVVSYAASFGHFAPQDGLHPWWADKLRRFTAISVRDHTAKRLVRDALGFEPALVLDPCLQFPEAIRPGAGQTPDRPYLAVYGHSFPGWFRDRVRAWAEARNLDVVSIGYCNDWVDRSWIEAGPQDFAGFMAGAEAVATNFFHGCVFSLVNAKPFACALSDYRFHKVRDLVATAGAADHLMTAESPAAHYDAALGQPLAPTIFDRIARLRRQSDQYLDHVLRHLASPAETAVAE